MSISTEVTPSAASDWRRSWTFAPVTGASGTGLATPRGAVTSDVDVELAATLSAYPLYGGDLRLVLAWPRRRSAHPRLRRDIRELAEVTGAVVWTPPEGGCAGNATDEVPADSTMDSRLSIEPLVVGPVTASSSPEEAERVADNADPGDDRFGPDPTRTGDWIRATVFLARPELTAAPRGRPHNIAWLPDVPQVNDEPFVVYVDSSLPASRAAIEGIASPHLFLVGHLDRERQASTHLLRLPVGPRVGIDVPASGAKPPPELRHLMNNNDAYVIPAAWLDQCQLLTDEDDETGVPSMLYCAGAGHGVDGPPEAVGWWAHGWGLRVAYAIVPQAPEAVGPWLRLYRHTPGVQRGQLVELRIGRRGAIDIDKTAAKLASLPSVRTILPELRTAGVELVLPRAAFVHARVVRTFAPRVNAGASSRRRAGPRSHLWRQLCPRHRRNRSGKTGEYVLHRSRELERKVCHGGND